MKRPHRARPAGDSPDLQMAPLIDAVYRLLTYFLFTISLATIEGLLPSELALGDDFREEQLDLDRKEREVVVRMVQTGSRVQYFINDWPAFGFENVRSRLDDLSASDIVVIDPGEEHWHGAAPGTDGEHLAINAGSETTWLESSE